MRELARQDRTMALLASIAMMILALSPSLASAAPLEWVGQISPESVGGSGQFARAVACPTMSQCTAVDNQGEQVTFDPNAPGDPMSTTIDAGYALSGIDCPSKSQCTAVDNEGREVTFDPAAPSAAHVTMVSDTSLSSIACPSTSECVAVGNPTDSVVTFDPGNPQTTLVAGLDPSNGLVAVACPSLTQCTAIDSLGREVTFDPAAPGSAGPPTTLAAGSRLQGVACPSTSQCTAVDNTGRQVTFNPTALGSPTYRVLAAGTWLWGVACPADSQCTAIGESGETTFNPTEPSSQMIGGPPAGSRGGVACPSTAQCTAVVGSEEVTFNPEQPIAEFGPYPPDCRRELSACLTVRSLIFDGRRISVESPSVQRCVPPGQRLAISLVIVVMAPFRLARFEPVRATVYLDGGIRHSYWKTVRAKHGHKRKVAVTTYSANATTRRLPASIELSVAPLSSGLHKLTVHFVYKRIEGIGKRPRHRRVTSTVRTLSTNFAVC